MSTDHHLEDNADDQVRTPTPRRRDIRELEDLQRDAGPTPVAVRTRHLESAIAGAHTNIDLHVGETYTDLVGHAPDARPAISDEMDRRRQVQRTVGEDIPAGALLEVRADGRIYAVDETAADLAEQLVDVATDAEEEKPGWATAAPYDFAETIAGMASHHLQQHGLALEVVAACTGCGCTDARACAGGCYWLEGPDDPAAGSPPRCSSCGPVDGGPNPPPEPEAGIFGSQDIADALGGRGPEQATPTQATLLGVQIRVDDGIPEGHLELRDTATGKTLVTFTGIGAGWTPTDEDLVQLHQSLIDVDDIEPWAAAQTVTRKPESEQP